MPTGIHEIRLRYRPALFIASSLLIVSATLFSAGAARETSGALPQKAAKQKHPEKPPAKDLPMPFHVGETLNYRVSWTVFANAGTVQLNIPERRSIANWPTWHFHVSAHTLSPARSLAAIDDQFDSYTDSTTLESRQFEMHLDEMERKKEQTVYFATQGQNPRPGLPATFVLADTRDPLGALYALRGVDWQKTPEYHAPVYDGKNLFDMHARMEAANETVAIAAGKYPASRISIRIFQSGAEVSGSSFLVWLAHDSACTPVLMQADIPFGSIRVELTSSSQ